LKLHISFYAELQTGRTARGSATDILAVSFGEMATKIGEVYVRYLKLMPNVRQWVDDTSSTRPEFSKFLFTQANDPQYNTKGLGVGAFLIQPLQRVVGYMLMLERLVNTMAQEDMCDHISYAGLVEASSKIKDANIKLDNSIREHSRMLAMQKCIAGLGARNFASGGRILVREEDAIVVIRWYRRSMRRLGGKKREEREVPVRLFLLSDKLLIVSPNIDRNNVDALYRLERELPLSHVSEVIFEKPTDEEGKEKLSSACNIILHHIPQQHEIQGLNAVDQAGYDMAGSLETVEKVPILALLLYVSAVTNRLFFDPLFHCIGGSQAHKRR